EKIRIEIAVNNDYVDETVKAIIKGAKSGTIGDGKIFVMPLDECIRIRTDETGHDAIG
ncbi:MAG: P-II family nitrogen regulator, partial [Verrucomicrobiota bacterium]|nr:P-II family nitrogen regulator [Verrucomicrobiota bacterium]